MDGRPPPTWQPPRASHPLAHPSKQLVFQVFTHFKLFPTPGPLHMPVPLTGMFS